MYSRTLSTMESLTETTKYSSCQPNFVGHRLFLLIQNDDSSFDELHQLFYGLIRAERDQTMDVIYMAIEEINENVLFTRVFSNMLEDLGANFIGQIRFSVFGRPHKMQPHFDIRHGEFLSSAQVNGNIWAKALREYTSIFPPAKAGGNSGRGNAKLWLPTNDDCVAQRFAPLRRFAIVRAVANRNQNRHETSSSHKLLSAAPHAL